MGSAVFPVFDPPLDGQLDFNGKALCAHLETLDAWAQERGIEPLSAFLVPLSESEIAALLGDDVGEVLSDDDADADAEPTTPADDRPWFSAERGRATTQALLAEEAIWVRLDAPTRADVVDLDAFLARAATLGLQWRLEIDF